MFALLLRRRYMFELQSAVDEASTDVLVLQLWTEPALPQDTCHAAVLTSVFTKCDVLFGKGDSGLMECIRRSYEESLRPKLRSIVVELTTMVHDLMTLVLATRLPEGWQRNVDLVVHDLSQVCALVSRRLL